MILMKRSLTRLARAAVIRHAFISILTRLERVHSVRYSLDIRSRVFQFFFFFFFFFHSLYARVFRCLNDGCQGGGGEEREREDGEEEQAGSRRFTRFTHYRDPASILISHR